MPYKRPGFEIEAGYGGAIAMLLLPEDAADEVVKWGDSHINDEEVYGKDGKGRDGSPHITLQNGIMCDNSGELEKLFSQIGSMEAELGPIGVFRQEDKDYDVVHIKVLCDEINDANSMVSDLLEVNNPHAENFQPHVTLAYVNRGAGKRFEGLEDFVGRKVLLSKLAIDGPGIEPKMIDLPDGDNEVVDEIYRVEHLPGSTSEGMSLDDFDTEDIDASAEHEMEHTDSIEIARGIAMDHLAEDPDYYRKLEKIEASKKVFGCREPLKESLDYGNRGSYIAEDIEDFLLSSGRSIKDLSPKELECIIHSLEEGARE